MAIHSSIEKAKQLYQICENETQLQKSWRSAIDESLERMGGWPVLNQNWRPSPTISLSKLYGFLTLNYSQESLIKFTVGADDKNSTKNIFQVMKYAIYLYLYLIYNTFISVFSRIVVDR